MTKKDLQEYLENKSHRYESIVILSQGKYSGKYAIYLKLLPSYEGGKPHLQRLAAGKGAVDCEKALQTKEKYEKWVKSIIE